jgi:hypothetical protein
VTGFEKPQTLPLRAPPELLVELADAPALLAAPLLELPADDEEVARPPLAELVAPLLELLEVAVCVAPPWATRTEARGPRSSSGADGRTVQRAGPGVRGGTRAAELRGERGGEREAGEDRRLRRRHHGSSPSI